MSTFVQATSYVPKLLREAKRTITLHTVLIDNFHDMTHEEETHHRSLVPEAISIAFYSRLPCSSVQTCHKEPRWLFVIKDEQQR
jgi:hypothetical protein